MAEYKRRLMGLRTRENAPIGLATKAVMAHCWTYVDTAAARAYYAGQCPRPRVVLHHGLQGFADELDISVKQLRRHLAVLHQEMLILWNGGDAFEVLHEGDRIRLLALDPKMTSAVKARSTLVRDTSVPDERDRCVPIEGHICPENGTHLSPDRDTSVPPSLVGSGWDQVGIGCGSRARARPDRTAELMEIALEIVRAAPQPRGAPSLPPTIECRHAIARLLADGWRREQIETVLAAAPAVIEAEPEKARFYGGAEMFSGRCWTFWRQDVERLSFRPASRPAALVAPPVETDRRAAEERERLRELLAAVERPPRPNDFDRRFWRGAPRWKAALMFAPSEAQARARRVLAAAGAEGRDVALAELVRELNAVEFPDPEQALLEAERAKEPVADPVLHELRRQRETAGRPLTVEELQAIGGEQ